MPRRWLEISASGNGGSLVDDELVRQNFDVEVIHLVVYRDLGE